MFFRTKTIRGTRLLQLVESYRNQKGQPRQRVVASLGSAHIAPDEKKQIAQAVEYQFRGYCDPKANDLSAEATHWVARILLVIGRSKSGQNNATEIDDGALADLITTETVVQLAPQLLASAALQMPGRDQKLPD